MQIPPSPIRPLLKKLIVRGLTAVDARTAVGRTISRNGDALVIGRRVAPKAQAPLRKKVLGVARSGETLFYSS